MSVELRNESGADVDEVAMVALSRFVLDEIGIHPLAELSLLVVDAEAMEALNLEFMGEARPTDVLAFPMDELRPTKDDKEPEEGILGDVVLCPTVAEEQAVAAGHSTADELNLLLTHGILHLVGFDHAEPDEHKEMFGLQDKLLAGWAERLKERQT